VVPDFLDHLRSTFSPDSKISYDRYFEGVKNAPLLVLDDLGKQSTSSWANEKLYQIINHRYNAKLPTVITTNCSTDELGEAIAARLADTKIGTFHRITAGSYYAGRQSQRPASRSPRPRA
jgi:DNA replication protein DnaC